MPLGCPFLPVRDKENAHVTHCQLAIIAEKC